MNKLKALALACALSLPASAGAMTEAEYAEAVAMTEAMEQLYGSPEFGETGDGLPDIAVSEVRTGARDYRAGSQITGSFTATNPTDYPAEGTYRALLVGNFDELGQYRTAYGVEEGEEVFTLSPGETREIPFSMAAPAGLTGDGLRVRVQARLVGSQMRGWADSDEISVAGDGGYATVLRAYLVGDDGVERALGSGPFLDDRLPAVDLVASFSAGPKEVVLSPRATLVNRGSGAEASFTGPRVTVPANGRAEGRLSFPRGDLAPGVYEGDVRWLGADGAERASSMPVRIVVVGESATVHSILSSAGSVSAGQDFTVTLNVSGTPRDPEAPAGENAARSIWQAEARVEVTAGGATVGRGSWRGVLPADGSVTVPVSADRDGADLRAKVTILGSKGQVVLEREYALGAAAGADVGATSPDSGLGFAFWWSISAAAALLVLLVIAIAWRHRAAAASAAALGLVLAASIAAGQGGQPVEAAAFACPFGQNEWNIILNRMNDSATNPWKSQYTLYREACETERQAENTQLLEDDGTFAESVPLGIYINTPPSNTKLYCGQSVHVTGTAYYTSCYNTGMDAHTKVWITRLEPDGSWVPVTPVHEVSYSVGASDVHEYYTIDTPFALDTDLTTRDGKYRINVTAQTYGGLGTPHASGAYRDFLVQNCDLCANIPGDQNVVPGGMSRDAAKNCQCPSGSAYVNASGQCEDDGVCVTCGLEGSCPAGTKYCDGVCIPSSATCGAAAVTQCPIEPESQYCAEIYDRTGARTDQFAGYTAEELEAIFGLGLREALDKQSGAGAKDSIWGVVGRSTSLQGGLDARHGSSGCAGVLCTYGIDGCLATSDVDSGDMAANCSPINDPVPGGLEPRALLVIEPTVINQGESCRVSWSSHEMRTCSISGAGISSTALAGSKVTPALQETASYRLTCVDSAGKTHEQVESCNVDPDVAEF